MQPNLTAAADGTVSVAFYDRRLACPAAGTKEAAAAGLALDTGLQNAGYTGPVPPFGAANYCVNTSIQLYTSNLNPIGHNIPYQSKHVGPAAELAQAVRHRECRGLHR